MTIQSKKILTSILFVLISFVCIPQGNGMPNGMPPPPVPPPPKGLPIDGGVLIGAFFALIYGAKKISKSN